MMKNINDDRHDHLQQHHYYHENDDKHRRRQCHHKQKDIPVAIVVATASTTVDRSTFVPVIMRFGVNI